MPNSLFDNFERTDTGPAGYSTSAFEYLNDSGRKELSEARGSCDSWFANYQQLHPEAEKDMRARFRSPNDDHHYGALTELFLHQVLLDQEYQIVVNPQLTTGKTPDFLVSKDGEAIFYLEITTIGDTQQVAKLDKLKNVIQDEINKIISADFFVMIHYEAEGNTYPPISKIRKSLQNLVEKVDYYDTYSNYEQYKILPVYRLTFDEWRIRITLAPKPEEGRQKSARSVRALGMVSGEAWIINTNETIKKAVKAKAYKYKGLDLPFVVAINIRGQDAAFMDDREMMSALFGQETIIFSKDDPGKSQVSRNMDGIYVHPKIGIVNKRLSGVLMILKLYPWDLSSLTMKLWHHPEPNNMLDPKTLTIPQKIYNPHTYIMEDFNV